LKKIEFLVETEILVNHLTWRFGGLSDLEKALIKGEVYTTVLNSAELISLMNSEIDKKLAIDVLSGIHVLGLPARYSLQVSEFFDKTKSINDSMFCVTANLNKLPILTKNPQKYTNCNVEVISTDELEKL
jgi:hypothetical protein